MVINTLGDYSINTDGRIISFSRKKSRLLFSILLANHPNPIHEEELIDVLLSGKQINNPKSNIRTIASSARKSLLQGSEGSTSYLEYSNNMYSLKIPKHSQIDFMEIDELSQRIIDNRLSAKTISENDVQTMKAVLDLYQGDFLPEYRFEEFSAIVRERTKNQYLHMLSLLLEYLLHIRNYTLAEKYVLDGLDRDPFWDDGIKLAIRLFHKSGKSIKAIKLYKEYERRLDEELGVEPSKEIQTLHEKTLV
jgi:two-component SAPR family response regulator